MTVVYQLMLLAHLLRVRMQFFFFLICGVTMQNNTYVKTNLLCSMYCCWVNLLDSDDAPMLYVHSREPQTLDPSQHAWPLDRSQPGLGVAFTLYLTGWRTTPNLPSRLGREWFGGTDRIKRCRIQDKKRNSSILAKASPKHTRIPVPNGK